MDLPFVKTVRYVLRYSETVFPKWIGSLTIGDFWSFSHWTLSFNALLFTLFLQM
jgi:hypothetical protein